MAESITKRKQTIGYFGSFISLGLTTASLGPALPYLAQNTNSGISEISILFTAKSGGYLIGSIIGGRLYDRLQGHVIALVAILGIIGTLALTPIIPLLWILTLVLLTMGIVEGTLDVGCNTMLVWIHGSKVGPYMNALHFFFGIGSFLSPIVIAQSVLHSGQINWGFFTLAFMIMPLAFWMMTSASPPHPKPEKESNSDENIKLIILIMIFLFTYVGAEVGFGGWVFTYALELNLANAVTGAYLTSAFWGTFTIGRLLGIPIASRVRPRWILLGDLTGSVISLLIIILFPGSTVALWVGSILLGLFLASIFPTVLILAERRMVITGTITSWFFVGSSLGAMVFPWLMGQLFESINPIAIMYIITGDILLAGIFYGFLIRLSEPITKAISR